MPGSWGKLGDFGAAQFDADTQGLGKVNSRGVGGDTRQEHRNGLVCYSTDRIA
jgi:hypothetical protein